MLFITIAILTLLLLIPQINIALALLINAWLRLQLLTQKRKNLILQLLGSHIIMVALDQLQMFVGFGLIVQMLGMFHIHKCIIQTPNIKNRAFDFLYEADGLQPAQIEISGLLLPQLALNIGLDRVDDTVEQKWRQEGQIVITQLVNQHLQVTIWIIRNNSIYACVLGSVEQSSGCAHTPPP